MNAHSYIIPEFSQADRLRKAREQTGLDQRDFAKEMDVSRQTVSNYEAGKVAPRKMVLKMWALRTGVPLEWLETGLYKGQVPPPEGVVRPEGFEPPTF